MLVQTTVFYLNYCNDLRSVLSALAPGSFSCSLFLSSLLRTFNDFLSKVCPLSCQSFLKSHFPLLFPTLTLDTLALLFLKISMDLSVYFRALVLPVPSALSSHGIPRACSHTFFRVAFSERPSTAFSSIISSLQLWFNFSSLALFAS